MSHATIHRCGVHPCKADAEPGHSTCVEHRGEESQMHDDYWEFRRRLAAEDQFAIEEQRAREARREARIREILSEQERRGQR